MASSLVRVRNGKNRQNFVRTFVQVLKGTDLGKDSKRIVRLFKIFANVGNVF